MMIGVQLAEFVVIIVRTLEVQTGEKIDQSDKYHKKIRKNLCKRTEKIRHEFAHK